MKNFDILEFAKAMLHHFVCENNYRIIGDVEVDVVSGWFTVLASDNNGHKWYLAADPADGEDLWWWEHVDAEV